MSLLDAQSLPRNRVLNPSSPLLGRLEILPNPRFVVLSRLCPNDRLLSALSRFVQNPVSVLLRCVLL